MKKMTKGAIVTGLGVALLLGGGGTLAVWNGSVESTAGTVAAGNLALSADEGVWTSLYNGKSTDLHTIEGHKVVPGEKLIYTQVVKPILDGDNLNATLKVDGDLPAPGSDLITITEPVLENADGDVLPSTVLTKANTLNQPVTASTTFAFSVKAGDPGKEDHMNDKWDFSSIRYVLEQQAPATPDAP
jgi:alternate signal-mediated exported protein